MAYINKSKTDDWATPKYIYEQVIAAGLFDPCPLHSTENGLCLDWGELCFVNPPYSQLKKWVEKAIEEAKKGKSILLLIPSRTDTKAFRSLYNYGTEFHFIEGRLKFGDAKNAPFPSVICKPIGGGQF